MTRNLSDADGIWMETENGASNKRQRQPLGWPTAVFGLGVLAFLAVFVWLVTDLIRDLAG